MNSMLVLLPPDDISSQISEFRENFCDSSSSLPAFINVFPTFVAFKDINRALNRVCCSKATPVVLNFDSISYKQVNETVWSVVYKLSDETDFQNLWNQLIVSSPSSVIRDNPAPEPYLHICDCSYEAIADLQACASEELGCLSFKVDTLAALSFDNELSVVSRKFGLKPIQRPVISRPMVSAPAKHYNKFALESQDDTNSTWIDFSIDARDNALTRDYSWSPNLDLEDFGVRGYYLTKRPLKCQTAQGTATIPKNTIVLVQTVKHLRAEIVVPQTGWIDFRKNLLTPLWKPEMRPGLYKTTCDVKVNKRTVLKGTKVVVNFTCQQQKRVWKVMENNESKRVFENNGKVTDRVHVSVQGRLTKGFMSVVSKRTLALEYLNLCFEDREFQDVSLSEKTHTIRARGGIAFKPFVPPMQKASKAESVVSVALSLDTVATSVSGVSSRSSSSISSHMSSTGSKFGQAGIYVLKQDHNVYVTEKFEELLTEERFNRRTQKNVSKDALIRKGQPVSVWKVVGDRAQIVAPFEGWIKFGPMLAVLKTFSVAKGELFEIRARKPTLVLNSNSLDGYIVGKLKKGSKVKVERVEGASALISFPMYGWIDSIASAMTRFEPKDVKPKLVLNEVPVEMATEAKIVAFLQKNGIICSIKRDGKKVKKVHVFVKRPRKTKKLVAVTNDNTKHLKNKPWLIKKKEQMVDEDFTSVNLTFESKHDAQLALEKSLMNPWVPTHKMPLKWSSHYKKLTADL